MYRNLSAIMAAALFVSGCSTLKIGRAPANLALGAAVTASSTHREYPGEGPVENLVDGDQETRWSSDFADDQSVTIDLGRKADLVGMCLSWEAAAAAEYSVEVSVDGEKWEKAATRIEREEGPRTDTVFLDKSPARYIRLNLKTRMTQYGFSMFEIAVY